MGTWQPTDVFMLIGLVVIIALVEWLVVNHTHKRRRLIEKRVSAMR